MKRRRLKFNQNAVGLILIALGLMGLWQGRFGNPDPSSLQKADAETEQKSAPVKTERMICNVLTVYDGDTLGCDLNRDGQIQKPQEQVRLLGVDSPEMRYSRKNPTYGSSHPQDEPFAKEASKWLTQSAQGKTVYLEFDERRSDKYERTLAYVFADAKSQQSLNAQLLTQGYATLLFLGKNRRYESKFQAAERQARLEKKGLWAAGF